MTTKTLPHRYEIKDIVQNGFITGRVRARFVEDDKVMYLVEDLTTKQMKSANEKGLRRIQMSAV